MGWFHVFGHFVDWLKEFRIRWRCIEMWLCAIWFGNHFLMYRYGGCENLLVKRRWCSNCLVLWCIVFHVLRCVDWCDRRNFYIARFASNNGIESIVFISSVFNDSLKTVNKTQKKNQFRLNSLRS